MIDSLLDACQFVLDDQGEPQNSYWLASQIMEMRLWRASEADVRDALAKDIETHGPTSRFIQPGEDEFALRSWGNEPKGSRSQFCTIASNIFLRMNEDGRAAQ